MVAVAFGTEAVDVGEDVAIGDSAEAYEKEETKVVCGGGDNVF